ncbi:MAG: hypothetical protein ACJ0QO_01430 [Parvicellaceae bacterium]
MSTRLKRRVFANKCSIWWTTLVNTMKHGGGKRKMKYTNKGVSFQRTKLVKKAIVTLDKGDSIDLYENI